MSDDDETDTQLLTRTPAGLEARVEKRPDGDLVRILDGRGKLLVEIREDGTVALHVADGDLELSSARGRVRIHGAEGVRIEGPEVAIHTPRLRQVVGVLETQAKRIVERAGDSYRDVEGLAHIKAKQVRVAAKKTVRILSERLRMRAKKDTKVQAEKIYLG